MKLIFVALTLMCFFVSTSHAGIVELTTAQNPIDPGVLNQGWWNNDAFVGGNMNENVAATTGQLGGLEHRGFFTFDLSTIGPSDVVQSAVLTLSVGQFDSPTGTEQISFWSVATDAIALNNNSGANTAIFDDLGEGTPFGGASFSPAASTEVSFILNADAQNAIMAAAGGRFSIGSDLSTSGVVFGGNDYGAAKLTITAVPEPSSLAVLGGLGCIACLRRRRR